MRRNTLESILSRLEIRKDSDCWWWTGCLNTQGYGEVYYDGRQHLVHRLIFSMLHESPGGSWVLHECDNPVCCNPGHLYLGTARDNSNDMIARGRHRPSKTAAKLSPEDVIAIRLAYPAVKNYSAIGRLYGIDRQTVADAVVGATWRTL